MLLLQHYLLSVTDFYTHMPSTLAALPKYEYLVRWCSHPSLILFLIKASDSHKQLNFHKLVTIPQNTMHQQEKNKIKNTPPKAVVISKAETQKFILHEGA